MMTIKVCISHEMSHYIHSSIGLLFVLAITLFVEKTAGVYLI